MAAAWQPTLRDADHLRILDYKLRNTARALHSWSQRFVGSIRLQLAITWELAQRLDTAQESTTLTQPEQELRRELKFKALGLSSMARTIARQRSRFQFLAEGDTRGSFNYKRAIGTGKTSFTLSGTTAPRYSGSMTSDRWLTITITTSWAHGNTCSTLAFRLKTSLPLTSVSQMMKYGA